LFRRCGVVALLAVITPGPETLLVLRSALLDAFGSRRCRMHRGMVPFS
jgi:threonine/homoserine/homoserine lactone efflux protein